jgi:glutamate/tyrosine decarboxylase-like PLP-dependent enzyme
MCQKVNASLKRVLVNGMEGNMIIEQALVELEQAAVEFFCRMYGSEERIKERGTTEFSLWFGRYQLE